ncbi:stage III sporulation protein AF [Gracilibacillus caseinilyticus]|uniref:Stage III sporulation protein AF n=1 Tax=Gracilibacillus caseinilyticus TaxID=2932256 RepID=A0ABY4EU33_9BACI|nr:stage III sporulation protein AF [Gracilibacillus caseinilyticus]UOQ47480.1 stage III sporulation protein AF [Gracilibacillus caseinilyticus]
MIIEYISNWILQVIIYIILAMLVDLLLPSNALKQYVKLVVGLLLILIILQPILSVFSIDVSRIVDNLFQTRETASVETSIENQMNQQKSEIEKVQAAYVLEEMVVQMENLVEEELQQTYQYQIVDLEVNWANETASQASEIEHIDVQIADAEDTSNDVQEVQIQIGETLPQTSEPPSDQDEVKQFLADQWGVEKDVIQIGWKEE